MTIRDYQNLLGNLIAERDKIFNQIALLNDPEARKHHRSMYGVSTNAEMIREVKAVCVQAGKWHIPEPTDYSHALPRRKRKKRRWGSPR